MPYSPPIFKQAGVYTWHVKFDKYIKTRVHKSVSNVEFAYVKNQIISELEKYITSTRVLTQDEVILGIPGEVDSMTTDTSPSWPFTNHYKTKQEALDDPLVMQLVNQQWENWLSDTPIAFPVTLHAKDELLPLEKIYTPRPFYSVDVVSNLNSARLVQDFNTQIKDHVDSVMQVGTDIFHGGADRLFRKHNKYKYHLPGDISQMDASKQMWMTRMKFEIRAYFFSKCYSGPVLFSVLSRLMSMYSCLDQGMCIDLDGKFCPRFGQTVTGHRATLEDNSLDMWMVYILALYRMKVSVGCLSVLGDDSIASTDVKFDLDLFVRTMADIGYTFTPPLKNSRDYSFVGIYEVEFLKFKFMKTNLGIHVALYSPLKLQSVLMYQKSKKLFLKEKINSVLIMSYATPFYQRVRKYVEVLQHHGVLRPGDVLGDYDIRQIVLPRA